MQGDPEVAANHSGGQSSNGNKSAPVARTANMSINGQRPDCFSSTVQEVLFVLTTTMAIGMSSLLMGSVTVITSFVGKDLNMSTAEITWITASSALSSGSFLLFFGKVADLFGRKTLFIGSMFLFAVFSLAAGFSKDPLTLDVLNGIMGLLSASAVPPAQGILGVIYEKPSKRKNAAFACFSAGNPLGFVFGTVFSGIATQIFSWRASYWLLAIIYIIFTAIAIFTVPVDHGDKMPLSMEAVKKFDVVGTLLTVAGIGMFSAALSLGGDAPDGWKSPYVLVLLILGVIFMAGFVPWEMKYKYPLVPMGIWRDRDFSLCIAILLLGFLAFPITTFWLSLEMQQVWGYGALEVAVHLLPMAIVGIIVNVIAALILHKVSNKLLMGIGAVSYTIAFLLFALKKEGDSYWAFDFPGLILCVVGADLEFNVANMYVLSSLSPQQQSIAGGIFQTVTKLCVTIGFGISTALFNGVQANPAKSGYHAGDPSEPYAATFWFSTGMAGLSVLLVPFLKIGTQGHAKPDEGDADGLGEIAVRSGGSTRAHSEHGDVHVPDFEKEKDSEKVDTAEVALPPSGLGGPSSVNEKV